jgi:hypothetical protein
MIKPPASFEIKRKILPKKALRLRLIILEMISETKAQTMAEKHGMIRNHKGLSSNNGMFALEITPEIKPTIFHINKGTKALASHVLCRYESHANERGGIGAHAISWD